MLRRFLQETSVVYDCLAYDIGTLAKHNDIWGSSSYGTITRENEYSIISRTQTENTASIPLDFTGDNIIIEFDYYKVDGGNDNILLFRNGSTNVGGLTNTQLNGGISRWNHIQLILDNINNTLTANNTTTQNTMTRTLNNVANQYRWTLYGTTTELRFKNFKLYSA